MPTYAEITDPELHFFNAVVHEILRVAQTVPLVFREGLSSGPECTDLRSHDRHDRAWSTDRARPSGHLLARSRRQGRPRSRHISPGQVAQGWRVRSGRCLLAAILARSTRLLRPQPRRTRSFPAAVLTDQLVQLKIFIAAINDAFFLGPIPPRHDTNAAHELITRQPNECFVSPRAWPQRS